MAGAQPTEGAKTLTQAPQPDPQLEATSRAGGALNLTLADLTPSVTNHLEFTTDLASDNWTNIMEIVFTPLTDLSPVYSTNITTSVDNQLRGFFRLNH
ncbi:MAG: hypothetical protein ACI9TH_001184 [Kiritimatiellia bacterium]|jgi:hypothetical protein